MKNNYFAMLKAILLTVVFQFNANSQTTLVAGDIAFSGLVTNEFEPVTGYSNDKFSFVLLKAITNNTVINFTDNGWLRTNATTGTFRTGEQNFTFTSNAAYPAGTEIVIGGIYNGTSPAAPTIIQAYSATGASLGTAGTCAGVMLSLNGANGDQILAFQGTTALPTFISAIHFNVYSTTGGDPVNTTDTDWEGANSNTNGSGLPTGLTTGVNAIWLWSGVQGTNASERRTGRFTCGPDVTTVTNARAALNNRVNWFLSDTYPTTVVLPSSCSYLVAACVNPTAYNVTGGGAYCSGGTGVVVGLSNSETGVTYQLKNGAANVGSAVVGTGSAISFGNQTIATTYTVIATRTVGACTTTMNGSAVVTVTPIPVTPTITPTGPTTFCSGGSVTLISSSATGNVWSNGATTQFISVTTGGTYTVAVTSAGCTSDTSAGTTVTVNPSPVAGVTLALGVLEAIQIGATYQWYQCGTPDVLLTGETNRSYTPTVAGLYRVVITLGGCTVTSTCVNVVTLGIEYFDISNKLAVYPNPFSNSVNIETELTLNSIEMYNLLGKKVFSSQVTNSINTSNLNSGVYFLKLKTVEGQEIIRKVVKN
ncbi:T9SS type A sorting domain-containing protein [Flavobacterium sp.]|uniref:T9SS type A sorting domain-containing protein n=1 Tax=Flavobacterium sp. TaxID=239 RepID=UPI00286E9E1E|nr:T9SS type A sorting domain-containing protein [Flavobacterium sp.]